MTFNYDPYRRPRPRKVERLEGKVIGALTVEREAPNVSKERRYRCLCKCGAPVYRAASVLKKQIDTGQYSACPDCMLQWRRDKGRRK